MLRISFEVCEPAQVEESHTYSADGDEGHGSSADPLPTDEGDVSLADPLPTDDHPMTFQSDAVPGIALNDLDGWDSDNNWGAV